jgi:hypothetical protein
VLLLVVFEMVFDMVVVMGGVSVKNSQNSLMKHLRFEWPKCAHTGVKARSVHASTSRSNYNGMTTSSQAWSS